jgi:hypothetical protein
LIFSVHSLKSSAHYIYCTMLRNVTLSAEEDLIALARKKAGAAQSTLNVEFRKWLSSYTSAQDDAAVSRFREVMLQLEGVDAGRSFTRDEMNER